MFTTGTSACAASSRKRSSLLVRSPMTAAWRENTSAVSRIDSPRVSWSSFARSTIGWPPISAMPASIEVRVRVEGCSNSSATVRPSSMREAQGVAFSARARSSSECSSGAVSSSPVRKWRGKSAPYYELRSPKPRSISSARSPIVPGFGSTPSWTAAP